MLKPSSRRRVIYRPHHFPAKDSSGSFRRPPVSNSQWPKHSTGRPRLVFVDAIRHVSAGSCRRTSSAAAGRAARLALTTSLTPMPPTTSAQTGRQHIRRLASLSLALSSSGDRHPKPCAPDDRQSLASAWARVVSRNRGTIAFVKSDRSGVRGAHDPFGDIWITPVAGAGRVLRQRFR
jgi:hypothetical protein